mgnify:CR=1 FL=1
MWNAYGNLASGLFGGYPVTGGFSRTAVNDQAGAKTGLAAILDELEKFFTALLANEIADHRAEGADVVS